MIPTINDVLKDTKNFDVHEWKLKNGKTIWLTPEDMVEVLSRYYKQDDPFWFREIPDIAFRYKSNTIFNSFYTRYTEVFLAIMLLFSIDLKIYPIFDNQKFLLLLPIIYTLIVEIFNVLRKSKNLYLKLVPALSLVTFLIFLVMKKPI